MLPALLAFLHVLLIALAAVIAVALAAGSAVLIWRLRRTPPPPPWEPGTLQALGQPAITPREVHLHLHGATAEDIAQALAQLPQSTGPAGPASHYRPAFRQEPMP